jgi:hypothetical protein
VQRVRACVRTPSQRRTHNRPMRRREKEGERDRQTQAQAHRAPRLTPQNHRSNLHPHLRRDPSEYVRRVGRTARGAGGRGTVSVLVLGRQVPLAKEIMDKNQKGMPIYRVPIVEDY